MAVADGTATASLNVASLPPAAAAHQQDADRRLRAFNDEEEENADTDFNALYQEVFSRVIKTPADMDDRVRDMQDVIDAFVQHAQVVAHVLVLQQQRRLTEADMWIKPDTSGRGVAGGQKFVVGKVFYKFATTAGGIYPSAAAAHKAAALEITAMNAVVGSNNTQMTVTLTALFLICGHCVIATAKAPLKGSASLVYGSDNAGHADRVIQDGRRCPPAVPIIRDLARTLGLAQHPVADGACRLWLPIDTEVHVGDDNRLYLIDLARLMPPVPPPPADAQNSYLYCHFRPEFLLRHPEFALSSDAFSGFARDDRDAEAAGALVMCGWR